MNKSLSEIIKLSRSAEVKKYVARNLYLLKPNPWHFRYIDILLSAKAKGDEWFNHLTFLYAFSKLYNPDVYLEVGVHKGGSLAQVVSQTPTVNVQGFDMWPPDYASKFEDWPLPHFASSEQHIRNEMLVFNSTGNMQFHAGDSQYTLPEFFTENPGFKADLALVDGDHSEEGASRDLINVINHAKCIVFDDIKHPFHPWLHKVWNTIVVPNSIEHEEDLFDVGTAVAIMK